ncbi:MAG TPA: isoprenylcysteine carboxylmethyltransferase family protein [Acidobacteriaceae bacterium]|jgi:protein-S-isoprenylcysteine O-methyltransferase Ste14|nr:isoprenylcysteine carboxylmethyltransferase family protein [Acidobacteriaceae bacterium]
MNLEFLFNALTTVWLVGEVLIALLTTTWRGRGKIQDRGTQIILWVVIIASFKADEWMHRFLPVDMPGSHSWLRPVALGIVILGLVVRAVAVVTLGRAFSANVAMRTGQRLRRTGLYRLVRHPSYLGLELILLGFALHARTWACFAVVLIPPTLAVLYRIHVEETALRLAFGAEYEDYSRTTKRLIPGVY